MNGEWIESFRTREEAKDRNYHFCKYCSPMVKYYRAELLNIKNYASENGLIFDYYDNSISIRTPYSQWKIIVNGRKKDIFLYHKNIYGKSFDNSLVPGYHSQAVRRKSIVEYMKYIVKHDRYRLQNPSYHRPLADESVKPGTKRYKKLVKKQKKQERYDGIMRTLALIDNEMEYRRAGM